MSEPERYAAYLPQIKQRWQAEQAAWAERRQAAWAAAQRIAEMLRHTFGASKIVAFGCLIEDGPFDARSDIDLAVQGIAAADFFRAYVAAMGLTDDFQLDLIDLADCPPHIRASILEKGITL